MPARCRLRARVKAASLALLVSACSIGGGCVPGAQSPERVAFRSKLAGLFDQPICPGPPTPSAFEAQEGDLWRRKSALLTHIGKSPLAEDLAQVMREAEEFSRIEQQADCVGHDWENPDSPDNAAKARERLAAERGELSELEADFARLTARCAAG